MAFLKGNYIKNDNGKYGQITSVTRNDDSKFGNVAFSFGNRGMRSDHEITIVKKSQIPKNVLRAIEEVKKNES